MKPFWRAVRYVWPYRYLVVTVWVLAILVAGLFFFSVGSVLPLYQLLFGEQTGITLGTHKVTDPQTGEQLERPYVVVPTGATIRWVEPEKSPRFDRETKVLDLPRGYDTVPGGLELFVHEAEGKWYHGAVSWIVGLLPQDRLKQLAIVMVAVVVLTALRGLLHFTNEYLVGFVACRSVLAIRQTAFDRALRLPLRFFLHNGAAEAGSRLINDAFAVQEGIQSIIGKAVLEPLMVLSMLVLAAFCAYKIDPRILLLIVVVGPLCGGVIFVFARKMRRTSRKGLQSAARILGILEESLAALRIVKAYSMEGRERRRFFQESRRYLRYALKAFKIQAATSPSLEFLATAAVAAAVVICAFLLSEAVGGADQRYLFTFLAALGWALDPLRKMANINNRLQAANVGAQRLFEIIDAEPESRRGNAGIQLPRLSREIVFDDVRFRYGPDAPDVLQGISLKIKAGETIAVVGRTGCGKTTLVNLVPRFLSPTAGRITIDGVDVQDVTLRSLRDQVGLVSQETVLFSDSIANNIAYGSRPAVRLKGRSDRVTRDEIVAAARMAHAHEFIEKLPEGYDSVIGTLGQTLSGGQRQRLALARAIIRDPAILILDEATSALDEETQALVQDTLEHFVRGRTVFIIAHRLSTIALADRIVVMDAGRIIDVGRHEELMSRCPVYRRLRESGFELT